MSTLSYKYVHFTSFYISRVLSTSANVLDFTSQLNSRTQGSADCAFKHLDQEREQGPGQRRVPPALRRLVTDEGVLSLHLDELKERRSATLIVRFTTDSTHRGSDIRILQRLPYQIAAFARNMRVLQSPKTGEIVQSYSCR